MIDKGIATQLIFRNLAKNNFIETLKKNEDGLTKIDLKSDAWKASEPWLNIENEFNTMKHKDIGYVYFYSEDSMYNAGHMGITLNPIPWYDGTNVIFGYVCKGIDVLQSLNKRLLDGSQQKLKTLLKEVTIKSCEIIKGKDFQFDFSEDDQQHLPED